MNFLIVKMLRSKIDVHLYLSNAFYRLMDDLLDLSCNKPNACISIIRFSWTNQRVFVFVWYRRNTGWMFGQQPSCETTDVQNL